MKHNVCKNAAGAEKSLLQLQSLLGLFANACINFKLTVRKWVILDIFDYKFG